MEVANTRTMQSGTSAWRGLNETHFHRRIVGTDSLTRRDIRRREQRPTRQKPLVGVLIFFLRSTTELVYWRYTANYAAVKIRPVRVLFLRTRFDRNARRFQRVTRKSDLPCYSHTMLMKNSRRECPSFLRLELLDMITYIVNSDDFYISKPYAYDLLRISISEFWTDIAV